MHTRTAPARFVDEHEGAPDRGRSRPDHTSLRTVSHDANEIYGEKKVFSGETAAPSATRPGPPHTRRGAQAPPSSSETRPPIPRTTRHRTPRTHPSQLKPRSARPPLTRRQSVAWPTPIARRISDAAASCTATEMRCITNGMYLRVDHVASVSYSPCVSLLARASAAPLSSSSSAGPSVFDLSVSGRPPTSSEAAGPLEKKQNKTVLRPPSPHDASRRRAAGGPGAPQAKILWWDHPQNHFFYTFG